MAIPRSHPIRHLATRGSQPLIGVTLQEQGESVIHYFPSEADADAALHTAADDGLLTAIGAWRDLDWDEMEQALHRIRHESTPTPPIEDL